MALRSISIFVALLLVSEAQAATVRVINRRIQTRETLAGALHSAAVATPDVESIINSLRGVFDFKRARPGDQLRLVMRDNGTLERFDYRQNALDEWNVRREGDDWVASKRSVDVEKHVSRVDLDVQSSVYEAALAAGEDPLIAMGLSDVLAWDVDFYQDVRKGDRVRALVEKYVSKGRIVRYGEVLAVHYVGSAVGEKALFRYALPSGEPSYFQEDGRSARKAFLKSPLKYANVTSRFGSRFHPILRYLKAHNGVDYGTPIGTPVWAVADGTISQAGYSAAGGKTVCLRHANAMETCYLHLSGFGSGVRVGARVSQKQVIAYSGNTGRSTGPHLHYAMKRGGRFVNPMNQNFPRSEPLSPELLGDFQAQAIALRAQMDAPALAAVIPKKKP
ncbi:MAG: M23 family metallopeptidase [Myxococcaceae bacterium]